MPAHIFVFLAPLKAKALSTNKYVFILLFPSVLGVKPRALQDSGKSSIIPQVHFNLSSDVFYKLPFQSALPEFTSLFLPTCLLIYLVPICVCI